MIGARFYSQLETAQIRNDMLENELSKVTESGKPWMDMAHIVQCLNKLDAGVSEKVQLVSRDGYNFIVVSYGDLRRCLEAAFRELSTTPSVIPRH
ncbi:hypothetical protein DICVIV_12828 [Dictyocaulus viviparus]|uniref:Pan3 C-terminal knob domain-containing protein n=1 Tax=Dictyocaulus viviparus TaxID=29172 RepID=A0A0D8X9G6_DICVI|nr:hypothetical protein DICVIV_12828 [Dictyocaulus viviparus]